MYVDWITHGQAVRWASIRVLPRGIDLAAWAPSRPLRRADPTRFRVLMACRLEEGKHVDDVIRAVASCGSPRVRLDVFGSGPQEARLRDLVTRLGVRNRVAFHGISHDMVRAYGSADVFVMASERELFGNTVLEALACGCPVIMRQPDPPRVVIGCYEAVAGSGGCLTYRADEPDALGRLLCRLDADRRLLAELSRAAARWADTRDWTRCLAPYLPPEETSRRPAPRADSTLMGA
jgi:glycosyltransferase involved in cell wall biosynthesis